MKFGTYHTYQVPPWTTPGQVLVDELERVRSAERLGFDSVWVPEQHFFDYCGCPDALTMVTYLLGQTTRVRVGAAVVNQSLTHPLRFVERASLLDHLGGGRVDLCIGRGYQWPQNVVFGVEEATTKARFTESLDIIQAVWDGGTAGYDGRFFSFPPVRVFPGARRPADQVLLMSVGGTTPIEETVERGLPLALASPFYPVEATASQFARYVGLLGEADVDAELFLDRAIVLVYALLAPTSEEARSIAKRPYEWHMAKLAALSGGPAEGHEWASLYASDDDPPEIAEADYAKQTETNLLFDDPDGFAEKLDVLRSAGVRNVVVWMGVGGVAHEHVLRSMTLFASEVMPRFTG
ncbi:MAG TPA: LLM class flavin-dependent oxidoreductase [Acidimicrobiales bacterium]|nr:LLM class flavin-dependent oxidoreductase [Acidimicrobiales bacterium]